MDTRIPGRRPLAALALAAAAVLAAAGCTSAKSTLAPTLYVTATGALTQPVTSVAADQTLAFVAGGGVIEVVIGNVGDADLVLSKVDLVKVNEQMDVLPNLVGLSFPRTIKAGEFRPSDPSVLKLAVHFTPGPDPDDTPTEIRLTTNDEDYLNGLFTFKLAPEEKAPDLTVNPPNYVFLNATAAQADVVDLTLSNEGSAALALGKVWFEGGSTAYTITRGRPNQDTLIDPEGTGSGNVPVVMTVEYRPQFPPDKENLVIEWGPVLETGVSCNKDDVCQKDADLCGDTTKVCPYRCGNGRCLCLQDADCQAYHDDDADPAAWRCLTGVCRKPELRRVELRGESKPGELKVEYGDRLTGCIDFTEITNPGARCTKLVNLTAVGTGLVVLNRPVVTVPEGQTNPYALKWYKIGASQAEECGEVTGTEITDNKVSLTEQTSPVKVAVTYTVTGAKDPNGELVIEYSAPFAGRETVAICGGFKKGEIEVAPPPRVSNVVMFGMAPSNKASKHVVVTNKGNDTLVLKGFSAQPVNVGVDPDGFRVVDPPSGAALNLAPGALLPVEVEFDGNVFEIDNPDESGPVVLNGFLYVDYVDPFTGEDARETVNLIGWTNVKDVTLPTAFPGSPADYAGAKVGQGIVLDAGGSEGGSFSIPATSGYTWFMYEKPLASKTFLNPGPGPAQVTFIPDAPGTYEFRLVVFSYDADSQLSFFGDEAGVRIDVAP